MWWILEVSWKAPSISFPFLFHHNSFGYGLEKALKYNKEICNTREQQPIKKKTEDTEMAYFVLYFLGSWWKH